MKPRDLELLSAYLDGQLPPSETARLESRLAADGQLAAALADVRAARTILRQLPRRKAPRNFTLTRKMVGANPPLPRSYSIFQFSSAFAALLLFVTFAFNALTPRLNFNSSESYADGMGGASDSAPQLAAPAIEEPAFKAPAPEAAAESPATELLPMPTESARVAEAPATESQPDEANQLAGRSAAQIPMIGQALFLFISLVGFAGMFLMRVQAKRKWR
ncbi:MAG: hypothetical protein Fur002_09560 [Anaerolineales bacterium]